MMVSNRNLLFQGFIFRFHVSFGGVVFFPGRHRRVIPCLIPQEDAAWPVAFALLEGHDDVSIGMSVAWCCGMDFGDAFKK